MRQRNEDTLWLAMIYRELGLLTYAEYRSLQAVLIERAKWN